MSKTIKVESVNAAASKAREDELKNKIDNLEHFLKIEEGKITDLTLKKTKIENTIVKIVQTVDEFEGNADSFRRKITDLREELAEIHAIKAIEAVEEQKRKLARLKEEAEKQIADVEKTRQIHLSKITKESQFEIQDEIEREIEDIISKTTNVNIGKIDNLREEIQLEDESMIDIDLL